jgi:ribulose 1,5-bisphosphate synthetase/thiazole synthase
MADLSVSFRNAGLIISAASAPRLTYNGNREVDVLVVGAGPTGLGAAKRLKQLVGSKERLKLSGGTNLKPTFV